MRFLLSTSLFILLYFLLVLSASAQDTIILMNGKRFEANVVEIKETSVKYRSGMNVSSKVHSIKLYRVFSINKRNGAEDIIFKPDTSDGPDFSVDQMRMFIKGEQDAQTNYHNTLNKTVAFIAGAGFSFFDFYGLIGPPLYSSIVGSTDPDINKQKGVDAALINDADYREGYLKISRDKKIRNSFVAGMLGFAVGFTAQSIIGNNTKK